jgi:Ca2+-transporting ATPase
MLGHQKKRSDSQNDLLPIHSSRGGHLSSFSTASSLSRQPLAGRAYAQLSQREPSPPASAYFADYTSTETEPVGTDDASSHFAYSTTLRRHSMEAGSPLSYGNSSSTFQSIGRIVSQESAGLLDRFISGVAGPPREAHRPEVLGGSRRSEKPDEETPSSVYAHWNIEVRLSLTIYSPCAQ